MTPRDHNFGQDRIRAVNWYWPTWGSDAPSITWIQ